MTIDETEDYVLFTRPEDETTSVKVLKHGATIISWKVKGVEQLWLSEAAILDGTKPVRGGIPLVFPVFGKSSAEGFSEMPQHGFARHSPWELLGLTDDVSIQFATSEEEAKPEIYEKWGTGKHKFRLFLTVSLGKDTLSTKIDVQNAGAESFKFNWLFHTYLQVPDIEDTLVSNLPGELCYDQLLKAEYEEKSPAVQFHDELDRIYKNVDEHKNVQVIHCGKVIHDLKRTNLPDLVVWNPWIKKSAGMSDFAPKDGYKTMVCIEPGHVHDFVELAPGKTWTATQTLSTGGDIDLKAI